MDNEPVYLRLYKTGELNQRVLEFEKIYRKCSLCPHCCEVDRTTSADGYCLSTVKPVITSAGPHFGEEPPLVGVSGSGTVFFTSCNLHCIYCQNYEISQLREGSEISIEQLAGIMLSLQARGCHNINLVTPTHMILPIVKALIIAINGGLYIPLVYNSSGYDSVKTLQLLDGIIDIYMPDFKYYEDKTGYNFSRVKNYPKIACMAIKEMYRQVGDLQQDIKGIANHGLIVRHLILPGHIDETKRIIEFIAELSPHTYLNLMNQYQPNFRAFENIELMKSITTEEYQTAIAYAKKLGVIRGLTKFD